jgi:cytochrome P450
MDRAALGLSSFVVWQLGWALMEIATHPEVQAKLHAELKKYHLLHGAEEQKRDVMPSDLPSLKYLRAVRRLPIHVATPLTSLNSKTSNPYGWQVLRESLRIHPTASFGTIRWVRHIGRVQ